jgi:hypothetical protein
MRKLYILFFILFLPFIGKTQFRQYNVVEEVKDYHGRSKVVYLTALWCSPCMEKLQPVIDSFGNKENTELIVVFDFYGMSPAMYQKLATKFDTSFFRVLPFKYYPPAKPALIRINPSNKVFKAFYADFNKVHGTNYNMDSLWVGMAIVRNVNGIEIAKGDVVSALLADIKLKAERHSVSLSQ